ncbi:MAG TPA: TonB-dependent receptor [Bacteroidales bacterium]|nr:TonB-dependent receptor [Bacteroidales bacterium]
MIRFFLAAVALSLCTAISGEDVAGYVRGRVSDSNTGEPLPGVYIIYGRNLGTTTDLSGNYLIKADTARLNLIFRFVGYETLNRTIILIPGDTVVLNVVLVMKISEIDQIVISADKTETKVAELTVSMDIVKSSFLSSNHITDAQEMINKIPGIEVMDGQASIRGGSGFSYGAGSRVLALIDGLPVLSADAGNIKWQFLPLENISQIEIIKGASSVLYGSSALNGIINFRTADATNIPVTQFYTEAGIYGKPGNKNWIWWNSPRVFSSATFSHLRKLGKTDFGISGNILIDEGYRRLNGEKLGRISLKIKHYSKKIEGLNYGLNLNSGYNIKKDFVLWEDAETGALKQSPSTAVEFHGTFLAIDPYISFKKSSRFQHDLRMRVQSSLNRLPESEQNNSDAISLYAEYQLWYRLLEILNLTAGISENYSRVNSNFFGDHSGFNIAGFTQFEIRPLSRLKAVAGLRIESFSLDGINDRVVPILRAGLNYQAADFTFLRASFGQGYRYPSIAEKFASTSLGSIRIIPNPDIISESGWSTELGIKQGVLFGKMTGQADFSIFLLQNSNLIEYMFGLYPEGLGFRATNVEQSRVYGLEIELLLTRSFGAFQTTMTGGYTFMYPVEFNEFTHENTDTYLKYRRKHSGIISLDTKWKKFDLGMNLYIKSKILNIDDVFLTTPILPGFDDYWSEHNTGHGLLDGNIGYKINDKFTPSLAVKNITNTEYMGRPGDIQPQRNLSVRFSGKF